MAKKEGNLKVVNEAHTDDKERQKSLDAAISQIDSNFGKGSVMKLGQRQVMDIESISTGSLSLDIALGIGSDTRIGGRFLRAGPAYGGSCFPKDTKGLVCSWKI